jgi:hypothetical protein
MSKSFSIDHVARTGNGMSKKFRAQGIFCESLDDGGCVKLWSSISETDKERGDIEVRVLRNSRRIQSRSARTPEQLLELGKILTVVKLGVFESFTK